MNSSTAEGQRRYPPDGIVELEGGALPCRCRESCAQDCLGECGCEACKRAALDYFHSGTASDDELAEFKRRYGG